MMKRVVLCALILLTPAIASATTITIDNFESGNLNAWNPVGFGQIVVDPLNGSNHALNFTGLGDGGNIWTAATYAATGNDWWFSFDYLGLPAAGNPLGTGGFIGWDDDTLYAGNERWLAGTPGGGADQLLIDDGAWHHKVIHLTRSGAPNLWPTAVHFKTEDWIHSDGIAGNAYFDNIAITDVPPDATPVPEPASLVLLASGLLLIARRLRRSVSRCVLGAALVLGLSSNAWATPITVVHTTLADSLGNIVPGTITASLDLYTRPYGDGPGFCCAPQGPATLVDQFSLGIGSDFSVVIPTAIVDTHASWVMPIPTGTFGSSSFPLPGLNRVAQKFPGATDVAGLYDWCAPLPNGGFFVDGIFIIGLRGTCTFTSKVTNMQVANGVGALIVNNTPGLGAPGIALFGFTPDIPVIGLSYERGQQIIAALNNTGADTTPDLVYVDFAARWDPDPVAVAAPEPASLALLGSGLVGLAWSLRMRRGAKGPASRR